MELKDVGYQEINTIIEAIEVWEREDLGEGIVGGLMGALFSDKLDQKSKDEMARKREESEAEGKRKQRIRREQGTMIKAKLIMIRDSIEVTNFIKT